MSSQNLRASLRSHRLVVLLTYDIFAWAVGVLFVSAARYDMDLSRINGPGTVFLALVLIGSYLCLGAFCQLHQGRASVSSYEELLLISVVALTAGLVGFAVNFIADPLWAPRTVPIGATICAVAVMGWGRLAWRRLKEVGRNRSEGATPALIFGAGDAGRQLVRSMAKDPSHRWRTVGLIDDDRLKRHLRIDGVPVVGGRRFLKDAVATLEVDTLIFAIPSAPAALVREIAALASEAGMHMLVLPGVTDIIDARVGVEDLRDIDVADLLGRHQVEIDIESIAGYLTGKRVVVTGAGGSIGSELCRQIHRFGPSELIMLDRDESALHSVQLSIYGRALLDSRDVVLGDIRDVSFVDSFFATRAPQVVFHAAALKHLPMLEQYPSEAVKTNVTGTLNVLRAARDTRVERFVNISTDKAANPCSVLGYSKRIAEGLTAAVSADTDGTFLSVRFGNVLGSRGSVLTSFTKQIADGGPVTVTHPEVTRYFMTVHEAVQLVIQAAAIGRAGEALVLDMGEPVSIHAVATQLIRMSGKPVQIEFTGLRDGEKMHEELFGEHEPDDRRVHSLISHVTVPMLPEALVPPIDTSAPSEHIIAALRDHTLHMNHRGEGGANWSHEASLPGSRA